MFRLTMCRLTMGRLAMCRPTTGRLTTGRPITGRLIMRRRTARHATNHRLPNTTRRLRTITTPAETMKDIITFYSEKQMTLTLL
jgi:hypothetical protein